MINLKRMFNILAKVGLLVIGFAGIRVGQELIEIEITFWNMVWFSLFVVVFAIGLVDLIKGVKQWISKKS